MKGRPVPRASRIANLDPQMVNGVLRVGGRADLAELPWEATHPIILDHGQDITRLIVTDYNRKPVESQIPSLFHHSLLCKKRLVFLLFFHASDLSFLQRRPDVYSARMDQFSTKFSGCCPATLKDHIHLFHFFLDSSFRCDTDAARLSSKTFPPFPMLDNPRRPRGRQFGPGKGPHS